MSSKFANLLALFEQRDQLQKSPSTANLCGNRFQSSFQETNNSNVLEDSTPTATGFSMVAKTSKDLQKTPTTTNTATATEVHPVVSALSSDSGKSSNSCSPTLLDYSFDSGVSGLVAVDCCKDMLLHKRIQQFQRILLALERDRDHFYLLRQRLR